MLTRFKQDVFSYLTVMLIPLALTLSSHVVGLDVSDTVKYGSTVVFLLFIILRRLSEIADIISAERTITLMEKQ